MQEWVVSMVLQQYDIEIIETYFSGYINGMISDITIAIEGTAYHLAARGLTVYTEILGGFALMPSSHYP